MSELDWQSGTAIAIVAAAVVVLLRRIYGTIAGRANTACGGGGCGSCSANGTADQDGRELPLVTLESTTPHENNPAAKHL